MKRVLKKLSIALLSGLAILVACELVMRALDLGVLPMPVRHGRIHADSDNPLLEHVPIPGSSRTFEIQRSRRGEPIEVVEAFNELGLRGPLFPVEKAGDVFRIACVGDSFTFGYLVNEQETWPAALQRRLDELADGRRFEVWNFGVFGYETIHEVEYIRTRVLQFDPDLVLLAYYINDALPPEERARLQQDSEDRGGLVREYLHPQADNWIAKSRRHSVFIDTIADTLWRRTAGDNYTRLYTAVYEADELGWRTAKQGLLSTRDALERSGIRFAMVLYPHFARAGAGFSSDAALAVVRGFCEQNGISALDLAPTFLDQPIESLRAHPYDFHPSGAAYELAADAIEGFLIEGQHLTPR